MSKQVTELIRQVGPYLHDGQHDVAIDKVAYSLAERYEEPQREYHAVPHLQTMANFLIEHIDELDDPRTTFWKVLGHDSIYIPELYLIRDIPGLNEEHSATLTESLIVPFIGGAAAYDVAQDIRATASHTAPNASNDLKYFLDADLLVLGGTPEDFDAYDQAIRREFHFVPDAVYRPTRAGILTDLLGQEHDYIFQTEAARSAYEAQARINIERKIAELSIHS